MIVSGERFELLNHGAQDISRYDFVRDVARVESVARSRSGVAGYALALTNDGSYWRPPTTPRETIDVGFRLHEGARLAGDRWRVFAGFVGSWLAKSRGPVKQPYAAGATETSALTRELSWFGSAGICRTHQLVEEGS